MKSIKHPIMLTERSSNLAIWELQLAGRGEIQSSKWGHLVHHRKFPKFLFQALIFKMLVSRSGLMHDWADTLVSLSVKRNTNEIIARHPNLSVVVIVSVVAVVTALIAFKLQY